MSFVYRLLDIEYEMTNFAYYYVAIGTAVFLLGYLQVSLTDTNLKMDFVSNTVVCVP